MARKKSIRGTNCCEVCGTADGSVLDFHHIIPQKDSRCTNHPSNLALLCASDHRRVHAGEIIIEGAFMTSMGPRLIIHHKGEPYKVRPGVIFGPDGRVDIVEVEDGAADSGRIKENQLPTVSVA